MAKGLMMVTCTHCGKTLRVGRYAGREYNCNHCKRSFLIRHEPGSPPGPPGRMGSANTMDSHGRTLLHHAAEEGDRILAAQLIARRVDANARDRNGQTPLHIAAMKGHRQVVEILLAGGADVNAQDSVFHRTPLHLAAGKGHLEIIELLLDKGADVDARDKWGDGPLREAVNTNNDDAAGLLRSHGARV